RFAVVVPRRVEHADSAGSLTVAHKVDDVLRCRIDVRKDLVPTPDTWTDELLQPGVLERIDARSEVVARRVVPIGDNQIFWNAADQVWMIERDIAPENQFAIVWLEQFVHAIEVLEVHGADAACARGLAALALAQFKRFI